MKRQAPLGRWVGWRMSLLALGAVLLIAAGMYLWFLFGDWWVLRQVPQAARAEILQLRADPQENEARLWALFSHYYPVRYFLPGIASRDWWVLAGLVLAAVPLILLAGFRLSRPLSSQFSAIAAAARRVASGDLDTRLEVAETAPAELRRLALDFNSLTARLQQYERDVRDSSAILAHELRTPLNAASVRVQGILDEVFPADACQLQMVKRQLDLLNTLVGDLHTLSLAEAGQLALDQRPFALAALVEERLAWFAPQLQAEAIRLHLELDPRQRLYADRDRIGQLLNILLENFLRYGASGGELEIVQRALAEGLVLEFRDRGPGIAEADRERVFHRFWRADSSRARHLGGSGLGLSIARAICAAHQGRIVALGRKGGGTVMRIELPGRLS
ncbi:signal transduction histidine kinase [Pseudomonas sp. SORGH_AS199]|jgi:signal transduction histidine kinase|uniref:histidine kinase n=1 Tax=Pseudomonas flavocrustae TaxID=2991719 RepID=A0ABT6ICB2_9PSED|nr:MULTISPECIES: ATP-binding protein [Pseudomonas]MDH4762174.1 ATP-binding protein [Pseudomonas sp. CBMAI 2609]MDK8265780.1 ATP-binding protein [Pseudomonas oryzihabitans]MDR6230760.1 signal transduction histidine kinase [Pseudomonas sp. SORGH_AS_0199]